MRSPGRNTSIWPASKDWPAMIDRALDDIEAAVLVIVRQRQTRAGRQRRIGVERLRERR